MGTNGDDPSAEFRDRPELWLRARLWAEAVRAPDDAKATSGASSNLCLMGSWGGERGGKPKLDEYHQD